MSMLFFDSVLASLNKKLNYDAVVNYAGNGFCNKSWEMIQEAHPFGNKEQHQSNSIASFFEHATVITAGQKVNPEDLGPVVGGNKGE